MNNVYAINAIFLSIVCTVHAHSCVIFGKFCLTHTALVRKRREKKKCAQSRQNTQIHVRGRRMYTSPLAHIQHMNYLYISHATDTFESNPSGWKHNLVCINCNTFSDDTNVYAKRKQIAHSAQQFSMKQQQLMKSRLLIATYSNRPARIEFQCFRWIVTLSLLFVVNATYIKNDIYFWFGHSANSIGHCDIGCVAV